MAQDRSVAAPGPAAAAELIIDMPHEARPADGPKLFNASHWRAVDHAAAAITDGSGLAAILCPPGGDAEELAEAVLAGAPRAAIRLALDAQSLAKEPEPLHPLLLAIGATPTLGEEAHDTARHRLAALARYATPCVVTIRDAEGLPPDHLEAYIRVVADGLRMAARRKAVDEKDSAETVSPVGLRLTLIGQERLRARLAAPNRSESALAAEAALHAVEVGFFSPRALEALLKARASAGQGPAAQPETEEIKAKRRALASALVATTAGAPELLRRALSTPELSPALLGAVIDDPLETVRAADAALGLSSVAKGLTRYAVKDQSEPKEIVPEGVDFRPLSPFEADDRSMREAFAAALSSAAPALGGPARQSGASLLALTQTRAMPATRTEARSARRRRSLAALAAGGVALAGLGLAHWSQPIEGAAPSAPGVAAAAGAPGSEPARPDAAQTALMPPPPAARATTPTGPDSPLGDAPRGAGLEAIPEGAVPASAGGGEQSDAIAPFLAAAEERLVAGRALAPFGSSAYAALLNAHRLAPADPRLEPAFKKLIEALQEQAADALTSENFQEFYRINAQIDRVSARAPL